MPKASRGGSKNKAQPQVVANNLPNITKPSNTQTNQYKTVNQAADFIKNQVGLDISKYQNAASKQWEKRGTVVLDISNMTQADRTKLANALRQKYSPYTGEQSGTWIFTIKKKKQTATV